MSDLEIETCNCIICAQEFCPFEMKDVVLCKINTTQFKICEACLQDSNPENDFAQVKNIINTYVKASSSRDYFKEINDFLKNNQ